MTRASPLTPLLFAPIYKEKVWGGSALRTRLGKDIPSALAVGESWEISGVAGDLTRAITGSAPGATLPDLISSFKHDLLGGDRPLDAFPLLYKFIDAGDRLSVQVHPDDAQARGRGWGAFGKTEAWYVVGASPGAQIVLGFAREVTLRDVRAALGSGTLQDLLNYIDVSPGDVLFVPAGTVHAILGGTLLFEIQEPSDITFRLYDWDRAPSGAAVRPLHIEESLAVLDTTRHTRHKVPPIICRDFANCVHAFRVACRYFGLEEFSFETASRITLPSKHSFRVMTVLRGSGALEYDAGRQTFSLGQSVLIPAGLRTVDASVEPGTHFLLSSVPDLQGEVVAPLRKQGFSDEQIAALGVDDPINDIIGLAHEQ